MGEKITSYINLEVWKEARALAKEVYSISLGFPKEELFCLTNQLRRSAISVPSNIAEGCGRNHTKDSIQFFYIARGSIYEMETQLYVASDLKYINNDKLKYVLPKLELAKKLLNGFINYYQKLGKQADSDPGKQPTTNN